MKNLPKTETPEVLCFSSMGNEPGLKTESRELTPAARAMRRRDIPQRIKTTNASFLDPYLEISQQPAPMILNVYNCGPGRGYEKSSS